MTSFGFGSLKRLSYDKNAIAKKVSRKGIDFYVCVRLPHKTRETFMHLVVSARNETLVWMLGETFLNVQFKTVRETLKQQNLVTLYYMDSFIDYPIRVTDNRNNYQRSGRYQQYLAKKLCFVIKVQANGFPIRTYLNKVFDKMKQILYPDDCKTLEESTGGVLAKWLKENNNGLYEQQIRRTPSSRTGPMTHEDLSKKFNTGFKDMFVIHNDCFVVPLDKWL